MLGGGSGSAGAQRYRVRARVKAMVRIGQEVTACRTHEPPRMVLIGAFNSASLTISEAFCTFCGFRLGFRLGLGLGLGSGLGSGQG